MSPSMSCEADQSLSPRMSVARRKEALLLRKTMKPLMEKRRRARINDSLNHLKNLILPLTGKEKTRYSKLEKADILEMTVRFLRDLPSSSSPAQDSSNSYREGFSSCLQRVSSLLPSCNLGPEAAQRLQLFLHQSAPRTSSSCPNCCSQSLHNLPQIQQKLQSLKSSLRAEPRIGAAAPGPQASGGPVWRPW